MGYVVFLSGSALAEETISDWGERLKFFRWMESYQDFTPIKEEPLSAIKRLKVSSESDYFLTVGGDYRGRYEHYSSQAFGLLSNESSNSRLQRFLIHGDLQLDSSRFFVQLSKFTEDGLINGPRPLDESDVDIQQAFYEKKTSWGWLQGKVKVGRQEFILGGGKKTGVREGPNQRRAFDGATFIINTEDTSSVNLFYMQEVQPNKGAFEDKSASARKFYGIHASEITRLNDSISLDLFYYGYDHESKVYEQGIGKEKRHSLGTRLYKKRGNVQFDYELTYQFGDFEQDNISAWGLATETKYVIEQPSVIKDIGVRINYASGDSNAEDSKLGTYNALYPNAAYVSESALFAPGNIKDIQPFVNLQFTNQLSVFAGLDFLWRASKGDGLYINPGFPVARADSSNASFYGTQFNVIATWQLTRFISLQGFFTHTNVGSFIKNNGGKDAQYAMTSIAFRF
jgi:hypothetical protein